MGLNRKMVRIPAKPLWLEELSTFNAQSFLATLLLVADVPSISWWVGDSMSASWGPTHPHISPSSPQHPELSRAHGGISMSPSPCSTAIICLLKVDFVRACCTHLAALRDTARPGCCCSQPAINQEPPPALELWTSASILGISSHCSPDYVDAPVTHPLPARSGRQDEIKGRWGKR